MSSDLFTPGIIDRVLERMPSATIKHVVMGPGSEAGTTHDGHGTTPIKIDGAARDRFGVAAVFSHRQTTATPADNVGELFPRNGIRFAEENAAPYNFARILTAKPLSTAAETALLPLINGKTTCSINQPHNPPPEPPARWPVFVSSNLPASDLVPSHA
jgi:hypothetical protein